MRKRKQSRTSEAASLMGKRSAKARLAKWGKRRFSEKMSEFGKLGGRGHKRSRKPTKPKGAKK